jgi:hypothetical protein
VIIWLNGGFGAGKTTLGEELRRRLPDAVLYDPEDVGLMPRADKLTPAELADEVMAAAGLDQKLFRPLKPGRRIGSRLKESNSDHSLSGQGLLQWHGLLVFIPDPAIALLAGLVALRTWWDGRRWASRVAVDVPPLPV